MMGGTQAGGTGHDAFCPLINRMKREVASSLVERGVTERVRLTKTYETKRDDLQRQHDAVKAALAEHRNKVGRFV